MIVVGTAGHIDHGKSAIVKRLTGTDPDRLPEEKARGMTIDLGFAFYKTANQETLALVDVPGHERFVKNMISGTGGIDAVMLVVAADDGWMPQSEEHFQITRLLGIKHGIVVINKVDLVENDWLAIVKEDIRSKIEGSFLDFAPIFEVSAQTGYGFDKLRDFLDTIPSEIKSKNDIGKARLSIDRSFIKQGIGTVVTGTLRGGKFSVGQAVGIFPSMTTGKIRTLQSNGVDVTTAQPGQRTAISITGTGRETLSRGGIISQRIDLNYFQENPVLALSVEMLPTSPVTLTNRRECLIITGTTEMSGEIRLSGDLKQLSASDKSIIYFKSEKPVNSLVLDHYILRLPTPMVTLGGGQILDHLPHLPRRREQGTMKYLQKRIAFKLKALIISELEKSFFVNDDSILEYANVSTEDIKSEIEILMKSGKLNKVNEFIYEPETAKRLAVELKHALEGYFNQYPHLKNINKDKISQMLPVREEALTGLLDYMILNNIIVRNGELYKLEGRGISLKGVIKQAYDDIIARLQKEPYNPPSLSELASGGKVYQNAIKVILESGEGYKCGSDYIFLNNIWSEYTSYIREHLSAEGSLKVSDLRERFGISRKYAIPILEETDRQGLTLREGDKRVKGDMFEN